MNWLKNEIWFELDQIEAKAAHLLFLFFDNFVHVFSSFLHWVKSK